MIRPYVLAETNWKHLKDENIELAVLPWGATEAHNYHLPYGTDVIEATSVAIESARIAWDKGAKVIVLPTVPFGVNTGQHDIYLDLNLNPSTQLAILKDILEVLNRQGIRKFMLLNSHGGNDFKPMLRELGLLFPEMFLSMTPNCLLVKDRAEYFDIVGDHADEMETSLLLYLAPDLVLPKSEWGKGHEKQSKIKAIREGWVWTERPWSKISEDTGVGNPEKATREKGEHYFHAICKQLADAIVDIAKTDSNNLYGY